MMNRDFNCDASQNYWDDILIFKLNFVNNFFKNFVHIISGGEQKVDMIWNPLIKAINQKYDDDRVY